VGERLDRLGELRARDVRLHVPSIANRATGKSMGEHCEEMAKQWNIARSDQDRIALQSHQRAVKAMASGFFDDLVVPVEGGAASGAGIAKDGVPRADSSAEKLATLKPAFDRASGRGTITAGNASPLTDGAAALWVADDAGVERLPARPRARLVDWEIAAVDLMHEGLLMAPAYAIPRLLARHGLTLESIDLWEIHEAFAAQVLCNVAALESEDFLREKVRIDARLGKFPWARFNPHGGSIAIGHPFGATGARILSQAVKELAAMGPGKRAVVSICADGGLATVALLESAG
jgi:acetyl-CoA C-acetyltransferase